jgi:putative Mg2+ transporter-C (MgtC) family protein
MDAITTDVIRLLIAILVGGVFGIERELRDKDAGFRTLIFICSGSTLFTIFSLNLAPGGDPARIAANIVSGVGFLGAGVILREHGQVRGLTTASTIWTVAALGVGIGSGQLIFVGAVTLILMVVLLVFPLIERLMGRFAEARTYEIVSRKDVIDRTTCKNCGLNTTCTSGDTSWASVATAFIQYGKFPAIPRTTSKSWNASSRR